VWLSVAIGTFVVNGPVLVLLVGPLIAYTRSAGDNIPPSRAWVALVVFAAGFAGAWLWWALTVPVWRVWAHERTTDRNALIALSEIAGLTWPRGSAFAKTEIKSAAIRRRERELGL
jgi:hypothetical protein